MTSEIFFCFLLGAFRTFGIVFVKNLEFRQSSESMFSAFYELLIATIVFAVSRSMGRHTTTYNKQGILLHSCQQLCFFGKLFIVFALLNVSVVQLML